MGRLREALLERVLGYADRVVSVAETLDEQRRSRRIVDQLIGSGTAVGANLYEAHQAISRPDFLKCLGWATKELSETRFWLRLIIRRCYLPEARLTPLLAETAELERIIQSVIARTKRRPTTK